MNRRLLSPLFIQQNSSAIPNVLTICWLLLPPLSVSSVGFISISPPSSSPWIPDKEKSSPFMSMMITVMWPPGTHSLTHRAAHLSDTLLHVPLLLLSLPHLWVLTFSLEGNDGPLKTSNFPTSIPNLSIHSSSYPLPCLHLFLSTFSGMASILTSNPFFFNFSLLSSTSPSCPPFLSAFSLPPFDDDRDFAMRIPSNSIFK